jgi:hypothetical protein
VLQRLIFAGAAHELSGTQTGVERRGHVNFDPHRPGRVGLAEPIGASDVSSEVPGVVSSSGQLRRPPCGYGILSGKQQSTALAAQLRK